MPDAPVRIDKLSPAEREKRLKEILEKKRDQKGTADHALEILADMELPLHARDEVKALREQLRDVVAHDEDRIDELRKKLRELRHSQHPDGGSMAAVKWALAQAGITENPAGSNWGHPVQDWIVRTGYSGPVPWCGCFAHEAVVEIGGAAIPVGVRLGYGPSIIADARAGTNGLTAVSLSDARPGDILSLWGGEHIALVRGQPSGSTMPTVEGNTSPGTEGSQFNGGCVAIKSRAFSDITVCARPAYA